MSAFNIKNKYECLKLMRVIQRMPKRVSHLIGEMTRVAIKAELLSMKQSIRRDICELQHQQRQRQRLRHESKMLLLEQGKISVLHLRHVFYKKFRVILCKTTT